MAKKLDMAAVARVRKAPPPPVMDKAFADQYADAFRSTWRRIAPDVLLGAGRVDPLDAMDLVMDRVTLPAALDAQLDLALDLYGSKMVLAFFAREIRL